MNYDIERSSYNEIYSFYTSCCQGNGKVRSNRNTFFKVIG